jgi:hypothetical protein
MAIRKLDKREWRTFCVHASRGLLGKRVEIEVASLNIGAQIEAKWLTFLGIDYDSRNDILEIALDGHDHLVRGPLELYVDEEAAGLLFTSMELIDSDGVRQILVLRDPLMLPSPWREA